MPHGRLFEGIECVAKPGVTRCLVNRKPHVSRPEPRMSLALGVRRWSAKELRQEFTHVAHGLAVGTEIIRKHRANARILVDPRVEPSRDRRKRLSPNTVEERLTRVLGGLGPIGRVRGILRHHVRGYRRTGPPARPEKREFPEGSRSPWFDDPYIRRVHAPRLCHRPLRVDRCLSRGDGFRRACSQSSCRPAAPRRVGFDALDPFRRSRLELRGFGALPRVSLRRLGCDDRPASTHER
ncbi:MAG: hypothetical protein RLY21_684 [Planctomycetota bacterium]